MTIINTNIKALFSQQSLRLNSRQMTDTMQQLSTGKRINSAKDDAAGLAISMRMTADLRGMAVSIRNANDGISMMQTADGALDEVSNMLQRMRELAVQAATGTMSASNREALQAELDQLVQEVDKVAKTIDFNGVKLLDGTIKPVILQVGAREGETVALSIVDARTRSLGLEGYRPDGQILSGRIGAVANIGVADVLINGQPAISDNRAPTTSSAFALAEAINTNSDIHGVVASSYNTLRGVVPTKTSFAEGEIVINGVSVGAADSIEELVRNINKNVAGISAVVGDGGAIELSNSTGHDIVIGKLAANGAVLSNYESGDASGAGFTRGIYTGFLELNSRARELITVVPGTGKTISDVQKFGLSITEDGTKFTGATPSGTAISVTDEIIINGFEIPASDDGTLAKKLVAINSITAQTGVTAAVSGTVLTLTAPLGTRIILNSPTNSLDKIGFVAQGGSDVLVSKALSISTQESASSALTTIDNAIQDVLVSRASLGAFQNRLTATIDNLSTTSSSLTQSKSRLVDADYAAATTELAKNQIIQQASTAILAQANADQQTVLKLLQ